MLLEDYATLIPNEVSPTHSPARAWLAYRMYRAVVAIPDVTKLVFAFGTFENSPRN